MDDPTLITAVSTSGFLPTTSTNDLVMPFTPPLPSDPIPQLMLLTPMQQPPLVVPVISDVVSAPPCFNRHASRNNFRQPTPSEPVVTVFVGNIDEEAPNNMIRHILTICGNIASWKRVEGFGFCEYYGAEAAMRAIKILHDMKVGGKKLVVKVDAKAQETLDRFKAEKKGIYDSKENQQLELLCRQIITTIITEYNDELSKEGEQNEAKEKPNLMDGIGFDFVPNENEMKNIIDREIRKFREIMKKRDEEKEIERKKKQEKKESRDKHQSSNLNEMRKICFKEEQEKRDKEERNQRERERNEKDIREREKKERRYKEIEEEKMEAKEEEEKRREREISYQKKCKQWEIRENQKKRERSLERSKNQIIEEERLKNAKKLKEFLENYDDEKDDQNYYKGRELLKLIELRKKELEEDGRDRQKEKDELKAIREKIYSSDLNDPELEFAKVLKGIEEMYKPKLLIDIAEEQKDNLGKEIYKQKNLEVEQERQGHVMEKTPSPQQPATPPCVGPQILPPEFTPKTQTTTLMIKKRIDGRDNDNEEIPSPKYRKLIPIDLIDKKEEVSKVIEERNKHVRQLLERIPTVKDDLFSFELDWSVVDNELIEKCIRPWINKKIIEYIGEPEPALVDFICSKVLAGNSPQTILDDVQMLIDEEAEVFVVKMWRLLVYEVEVKKLGFVKLEKNGHKNA